jgi:hypothetical protein
MGNLRSSVHAGFEENSMTRTQASEALTAVERDVAEFFGSLDPNEFVLREGNAWTPAEHLDHLNIAVSAVARGMGMRQWILRLRFGKTRRPSRTYEQLRDDYRAKLAAGGAASGRFVPAQVELSAEEVRAKQTELLERWKRVNNRLRNALAGWSEENLDRVQLPHPLLGKITAREMVFFTIYHNGHHIAAAQRRLPRFAQGQ